MLDVPLRDLNAFGVQMVNSDAVASLRYVEKPLEYYGNYGQTASFVKRWCERLPEALALGAGDHIQIPPGNAELIQILEPFERILAQMKDK